MCESVCVSHLILSLDDDDGHGGGRPAVLGRERLVTVPQDDDLTERGEFLSLSAVKFKNCF